MPDSREGWVEATALLIDSYFPNIADSNPSPVQFDYSLVRPAGAPIRGFGGTASGPEPLRHLHEQVRMTLDRAHGRPPSVTDIVDLMNLIGQCVVAGNVRLIRR